MLKELSAFENLGTPIFYFELLTKVQSNDSWTEKNINDNFYNRVIEGRSIFDGCIPLLKWIGIIEVNHQNEITLNSLFNSGHLSVAFMTDKFLERLFLKLKDDSIFYEMFSPKFISYDIIYNSVQIDNSAFSFRYSAFKQLLIDFEVLQIHPVKELNKFILNRRHKRLFDKTVLPEIRKRKIGIEEFQVSMEQKQIFGEEAEKFVLQFEHKRLYEKKEIVWVAEYSVSEGYDIASYDEEASTINDRFIEVKSYANEISFYWSRNEMNVARIKKGTYYLYLVDRTKLKNKDYEPIIIRDPYYAVFKNEYKWEQTIEKIRFSISRSSATLAQVSRSVTVRY
jgi:hypothetical protein